MRETPRSISEWAERAFGPVVSMETVARRATAEMEEVVEAARALDAATTAGKFVGQMGLELANECGDVGILLVRICDLCGYDLRERIDAMMVKNRGRKWDSNGDGTGRHVDTRIGGGEQDSPPHGGRAEEQ